MNFLQMVYLLLLPSICVALVPHERKSKQSSARRQALQLQSRRESSTLFAEKSRKRPCICPMEDDETSSPLEDRREALFAMMGSLWAATTSPAYARYGSDATMEFPNPVAGMNDRANKKCLVESLGNRECLVYQEDEEKLLYKGADTQVLLDRIQIAARALELEIPPLVEKKQWTKITGILTGPMGQLSSTMTLLCKLSENPELAQQKAQVVKNDMFAMSTATTNKSVDQVIQYQKQAVQDLAVFLKAL